jgi:hypothetical protein
MVTTWSPGSIPAARRAFAASTTWPFRLTFVGACCVSALSISRQRATDTSSQML